MTSLIAIGIAGCVVLLLLLLASVPVGFALALVGTAGFAIAAGNPQAAYHLVVSVTYDNFSKYDLSVIPLFILMGQVAFYAGISRRVFDVAYAWLGRLPGGLGLAAMGACTLFCSICGSGPASAATMTAVAMPEMQRHGYSLEMGAGIVAAGSSLSLMIVAMFFAFIVFSCLRHPELGPRGEYVPWPRRLRALLGLADIIGLFALVMGGMLLFGWFTPTEAAAVGAAGSIVIALCRRMLTWKAFRHALKDTARTSCMVLVIVTGALIFGRFLALTGITGDLASGLAHLPLPNWVKMGAILLFFMIAGCFVDALALVMLTMPIFLPVVKAFGYDPVWFGVMVVAIVQLGVITPPVGVNVYVVSGIERAVPMERIFRQALPFAMIIVLACILLMAFPQLALWLPGKM